MPGDHPTAPRAGEERALAACRDYEHWASEVRRLTKEIAALTCPNERDEVWGAGRMFPESRAVPSCFQRARVDAQEDLSDIPTLDDIAPRVADCPECSRLVDLIRARRHARQRYGVAKRAVRRIGKLALPGREHVASTAREGGENG